MKKLKNNDTAIVHVAIDFPTHKCKKNVLLVILVKEYGRISKNRSRDVAKLIFASSSGVVKT
jgi:hypothetical protein